MSGFKGTPGPWKFERVKLRSPGSPTFIEVVAADGPVLPWSAFDRTDRSKRENSHNARLIAAAPELLEALRKVDEQLGDVECESAADARAVERCHDIIRAAIAKATGGAA